MKNFMYPIACAAALVTAALVTGGTARADSFIVTTDPSQFTDTASMYYPDPYRYEDGYGLPSDNTVFAYNLSTDDYSYAVSVDSPGILWQAADTGETGFAVPFDEIFLNEFGLQQDVPGVTFGFASYITGQPALMNAFGLNLYEYSENFTATLKAYDAAGDLLGSVTQDLQGGIASVDPFTTNTFVGIVDQTGEFASVVVSTSMNGQPDNSFSIGELYMTSAPEPGTWALVVGGLVIFGLCGRRRTAA